VTLIFDLDLWVKFNHRGNYLGHFVQKFCPDTQTHCRLTQQTDITVRELSVRRSDHQETGGDLEGARAPPGWGDWCWCTLASVST